jgi:hypothetical protein
MPATPKQRAALDFYFRGLMEEAKGRLICIDGAMDGQTGLPVPAVQEFCFLQLRMLCELIALGCLIAHGDLAPGVKLNNLWAADKIVDRLEGLHPSFYPHAMKAGLHRYEALKGGFLTKGQLLKLNSRCGSMLHRGSLKSLFTPKKLQQDHFGEIKEWRSQIGLLLDCHAICLFDEKTLVVIKLADRELNNRTIWRMLEGEQSMSEAFRSQRG